MWNGIVGLIEDWFYDINYLIDVCFNCGFYQYTYNYIMSFFSKIVENKSTALAVAIGAGAVIGLAWYYFYYLASIKTIRMIATIQERMMLLMILILRRKSKNHWQPFSLWKLGITFKLLFIVISEFCPLNEVYGL